LSAIAAVKLSTIANVLANQLSTTDAAIGYDTTLSPERISNGVARYVDRAASAYVGAISMTLSVRPPTKDSRVTKVTHMLHYPILETNGDSSASGILPAPTKAYELMYKGEWFLPERSTTAQRTILASLVVSSLSTTIAASDGTPADATATPVLAAVVNLESVYGA
jgi:hypothetical protein